MTKTMDPVLDRMLAWIAARSRVIGDFPRQHERDAYFACVPMSGPSLWRPHVVGADPVRRSEYDVWYIECRGCGHVLRGNSRSWRIRHESRCKAVRA